MMQHMAGKISMAEMFSTNGIGIHFFMFLTYLKAQGTKEQKKKWLNLAMEGKFLVQHTSSHQRPSTHRPLPPFTATKYQTPECSDSTCRAALGLLLPNGAGPRFQPPRA